MNFSIILWQLCGTHEFTLLDLNSNYHLSFCFLESAIEIPIHALLAVVASSCLGALYLPKNLQVKENWPKILSHFIRFFLILCLISLNIAEYFSYHSRPPGLFIITLLTKSIAWILTFACIYLDIKYSSLTNFKRLPVILSILLLVAISNGSHLYHVFNHSPINFISIAIVIINLLIILTIIPKLNRLSFFKDELIERNISNLFEDTSLSAFITSSNELNNYKDSNSFSKLFFFWVTPLIHKGLKQEIKHYTDLFSIPNELNPIESYRELMKYSTTQNSGHVNNKYDINFASSLLSTYLKPILLVGLLKLASDLLQFSGPILLNKIVFYLESKDRDQVSSFYLCIYLLITTLLSSLCITLFNFHLANIGIKIKTSVIILIYSKLLTLRLDTLLSTFSSGEILNFASTDANRVANFCPSVIQFITLPLQLGITIYLLYQELGITFLAGLIFTLIILPLNKILANKISHYNSKMMEWKDKRIKLMSELLLGVRLIKMLAWEDIFKSRIKLIRGQEMKFMKNIKYLDALCVYFWATTPVIISCSTFTTYVLLGNYLTSAKVFTCLALFTMLITPLNAFPWVLNSIIEAWVSIKRLQKFLNIHEINLDNHYTSKLIGDVAVHFDGAIFKRDLNNIDHRFTLGPIDLQLKEGEFVGVIGLVGSGKSSLLSAIVAEMLRSRGKLEINQRCLNNGIGFVSQDPWIQNATFRDNILFGKILDYNRYSAVLHACALDEDIKIFANGDSTLIGDRGITLSGGQKSRIALARAIYQDFDFYLLDEPFANVDVHVAEHIMTKCIEGLLAKKAKIICTHYINALRNANSVIIMDNGLIIDSGPPSQVLKTKSGLIQNSKDPSVLEAKLEGNDSVEPNEEKMEIGHVKFEIYKRYWNAVGTKLAFAVFFFFTLMQISRTGSDWWLSYWTVSIKGLNKNETNPSYYLEIYAGIAISNSLLTLFRAFLFAYGGIVAGLFIHEHLLDSTLQATSSFFDTTSFGRIANRFSSDMAIIDDALPFNLNIFLAQSFTLIATLIITIYGLPVVSILILPLFFPYYFLQKYYRWTSRDLRRLCSVNLSPIYSHFAETIQGLSVIRSFSAKTRFMDQLIEMLNVNNCCQYAANAASQWLNIHLQLLGVVVTSGVAFAAVFFHYAALSEINPGLVGLGLAYSLTITSLLNSVVQSFSQLEMDMISIERAQQYIDDVNKESKDGQCPQEWPNHGSITFQNVSVRYGPDFPLALYNVTFKVAPREHIGIVGRTGSGKSTLFQTIFRMVPIETGCILIDGINIININLHHLRSNLFIIPQDAFLFSGSIRNNLDPANLSSDTELWRALKECHCDALVLSLGGLSAHISESGRDISSGQRQLLCLARAILSKAKIIFFDEITSNIDGTTEALIHQTIKTSFKSCTVLTIAHKLESLINCDKILVMKDGKVIEDDDPQVLKNDKRSVFYKLLSSSCQS